MQFIKECKNLISNNTIVLLYGLFLPGAFGVPAALLLAFVPSLSFDVKMLLVFWQAGFVILAPVVSVLIGFLFALCGLFIRHEMTALVLGKRVNFYFKVHEYIKLLTFFSFLVTFLLFIFLIPVRILGLDNGVVLYVFSALFILLYWLLSREFVRQFIEIFYDDVFNYKKSILSIKKNIMVNIDKSDLWCIQQQILYCISFLPLVVVVYTVNIYGFGNWLYAALPIFVLYLSLANGVYNYQMIKSLRHN